MSSYITLLAKLTAKPGKGEALLEALKPMIEPSRAEPGCLKYVLHRTPGSPDVLTFVEEWKSEAALDEHKQTPHYKALGPRIADFVANVEHTMLEPIE